MHNRRTKREYRQRSETQLEIDDIRYIRLSGTIMGQNRTVVHTHNIKRILAQAERADKILGEPLAGELAILAMTETPGKLSEVFPKLLKTHTIDRIFKVLEPLNVTRKELASALLVNYRFLVAKQSLDVTFRFQQYNTFVRSMYLSQSFTIPVAYGWIEQLHDAIDETTQKLVESIQKTEYQITVGFVPTDVDSPYGTKGACSVKELISARHIVEQLRLILDKNRLPSLDPILASEVGEILAEAA